MTVAATSPRRPRRIAADEAHAWARNLRLHNSLAKLVLSMTTGYVNGDGVCFVGIEALAEDTELSPDTVRKRLAWLETVGAIARFPQWIDTNGRRNPDGRGRRTSDEIRLLLNADPDDIESRAKGDSDGGSDASGSEISPRSQQGLNPECNTISPPVALCQPSDSGKGLTSEPEPEEDSPNPLSGGGQVAVDQDFEEDIEAFSREYPAPITNLPRLRTVLGAMTGPERRQVLIGVKGYANFIAECERKRKPRAIKDAHRWVSSGMWQGYVPAGEKAVAVAQVQRVPTDSDAARALVALHRIARIQPPLESGGTYLLTHPLSAQALALAQAPAESEWELIPIEERNRCGAWNDLIADALKGKNRPELVHDRNPGGRRGFKAPWPWPPRKDGSLGRGPPEPELTKEDAQALMK